MALGVTACLPQPPKQGFRLADTRLVVVLGQAEMKVSKNSKDLSRGASMDRLEVRSQGSCGRHARACSLSPPLWPVEAKGTYSVVATLPDDQRARLERDASLPLHH
jgi:hypothetical protein